MRLKRFPTKTDMKSEESERLEKGFERKKSDMGLLTTKKLLREAYKKDPQDCGQIHIKLTTQNYMNKMMKYRALRKKELMESDCPEILSLIHKMRTDEVHDAQQKLMTMVNSIQAMNKIFDLIQNNQLEPWVKTIASTFLNRVICQKLEQYGYKSMFAAINNIMASYNVVSTDKRCFERSIISLIEFIREPEEIDEWRKFILRLIGDPLLFDTGLLLISCSAISDIQVDYLCIIVEETFEKTIKAVNLSLQTAMVTNQLVKNWIVVFDKLRMFTEQKTVQSVEMTMLKICVSQSLAKFILSVYEFNSPTKEIWLCVNPELYELNLLKYEAAELNKKVANYALSTNIPATQCTCLKLIRNYYTTIKNTVAVVSANDSDKIMQVYDCENFITSLISLLITWVKSTPQHTQDQLNILLHLVCYPFLKTRQKELDSFEESTQEFSSLAQDLCDKQTFGILKSQAAKLLQTISDHSKSSTEKIIMFCVECIKMQMGYIPKYENVEFKVLDIDTAFQTLAICSFSLEHFPVHLEALKVILCDKRMMDVTPLEMSKIFLFLAYNYGEVFKNPFDGSFWIDFALSYKAHPTTRYMALDFISNIVDQYFTENFFNQLVKLIIEGLPRQSGQVWNIIRKLFEAQMPKITQPLCLNLVNTVFARIEREIEELQSNKKEQTINLINAIHILRKIVEEKDYMNGKDALKSRVFDIAIIFNKAIEFNLEDEIIKIMIEYMKINEEATKQKMYQYLPAILEQFKKEGYHEKPYFILLNEIIVKSKFHTVKPILKTLLTGLMFHLFDMSEAAKKSKMKVSIANILTLLQNLLSVHGFEMSGGESDCFCEIGAMAIRLFPQENEKIFSKPLLAKALNLMFICHIYSKTQNTVDYLIQYANKNIFHKYDAYVLIKLLSKALFAQDNVNIVIEYLNLMIQISIENQENDKKGNTVKNSKGKLKIKREQQMNELLYKITSPFIDFEYSKKSNSFPIKKEVVECVNKMKSNNLDTYKLIVMNMNEEQKSKLVRIMNETFQVEGKKRVIRKIVGARSQTESLNAQQVENENSDLEEEPESNNFKRQRVMQKKKEGKKKREDINAQ